MTGARLSSCSPSLFESSECGSKSGRSSSLDQSPLLHARERERGEMTIGFSESSQLRGPSQSRCLFFAQERAANRGWPFL